MARCQSCYHPLPDDRERVGARCPHCQDPLYEPASRFPRPAREGESACAAHAGMEAVGVCGRCGSYLCEVCRTRWRGLIWCAACVERALGGAEAAPQVARAHFRQALLSLGLGVAVWVIALVLFLLIGLVVNESGGVPNLPVIFLLMALLAADVLLAALGVGLAVAALRTRGSHMILATLGLFLGGLFVGVLLGLMTFNIWMS